MNYRTEFFSCSLTKTGQKHTEKTHYICTRMARIDGCIYCAVLASNPSPCNAVYASFSTKGEMGQSHNCTVFCL